MPHVLIVGAGPSGLVALKEMLAQGLEATVLEAAPSFGGVFRRSNSAVYDELYLTTSNYFMAFSDFAPLEGAIRYSSKRAYQDYLDAYVARFDLARHIRFETQVVRATFDAQARRWRVRVVDAEGERELEADTLIVATGSQQEPYRPTFEGFTGEVLHAAEYRGAEAFAGRRVLIVGVGESASDIAAEVAEVAAETVVWSRRPFILAPRFPVASMDEGYDEHAILGERPETLAKVNDLLELLSTSRMANHLSMVGFSLVRILLFEVIRRAPWVSQVAKRAVRWNDVAIRRNFWMQDQSVVVAKTMRLPIAATAGKLAMIIARRMRCEGERVSFDEVMLDERAPGGGARFDAIIACTGYQTHVPWLDAAISLNPRDWFRHAFPPEYDGKLVFLGWARPHQGGLPGCAELLARYTATLASGAARLPDDLAARIAAEAAAERAYYRGSPHVDTLVDYPAFMDAMAELVGCRPRVPNPLRSPRRFAQFCIYPNWPCWYRKDGVGRDPAALDEALRSADFAVGPAIPLVLLHALLFALSAPIFAVDRLLAPITRPRGARLRPGWRWRQPKVTLLHGNG